MSMTTDDREAVVGVAAAAPLPETPALTEDAALDQLTLAINAKGPESQGLFGGNVWDWLDDKDILPNELYHHLNANGSLGSSPWIVLGLLRGNKMWDRRMVAGTLELLGMTAIEVRAKFSTLKRSKTPRK